MFVVFCMNHFLRKLSTVKKCNYVAPLNKLKWNVHAHRGKVGTAVTTNINWTVKQKEEKVSSDSFTLKYHLVYLSLNMGFENIVANAFGGEKKLVLRTLMEVGLLQNMVNCNKNHERQQMILIKTVG